MSQPMLKIFLFDDISDGHHPTYLRLFSKSLLDIGCQVVVFSPTPRPLETWFLQQKPLYEQEFRAVEIEKRKNIQIPFINKTPRPLRVLSQWYYTAKTIKKFVSVSGITPDLVFFPWLDAYLDQHLTPYIVDSIFGFKWSGLFFHPRYLLAGYKQVPLLQTKLDPYSLVKSSQCRSVGFLDECEATKNQDKLDKRVVIFPDLADESCPSFEYDLVQKIKSASKGRYIVALIGSVSARKGLFTLLQVAEQMKESDDWFFVFVGEFDNRWMSSEEESTFRETIASDPENCFFHLSWIPEENQLNAVIASCDVLFAAYVNFPYSSNILTKAAVFEKAIIVSDSFLMRERIERFRLGLIIPQNDHQECIKALSKLYEYLQSNKNNGLIKPDFRGYRELHSSESLSKAFVKICSSIQD